MIEQITQLVLDESKWLFASMLVSVLAVVALVVGQRRRGLSARVGCLWAMSVFYGCMIGIMGAGHVLAVLVKAAEGTLVGSLWKLLPLGFVLVIPACWLAIRAGRYVKDQERWGSRTIALNAWLGISLLVLGPHNWPLAIPAALNVGYQLHVRRGVGWAIVTVAVALNLALLAGSLVFLISGQSFEQFKGM